jgi:hypothetical protein
VAMREVDQSKVSTAPVDTGADRRLAHLTDDQVAFPGADSSASLHDRRPMVDEPCGAMNRTWRSGGRRRRFRNGRPVRRRLVKTRCAGAFSPMGPLPGTAADKCWKPLVERWVSTTRTPDGRSRPSESCSAVRCL